MHKKKIYAIIIILGLLTLTAYSTVDAQATEPEAPKYPALDRLKYYAAHPKHFYNDKQNLIDATKQLKQMIKTDVKAGLEIGVNFEIPFSWLEQSVLIMELAYHLLGHGLAGQLLGALMIYLATWVPLRFICYGKALDYYGNDFIDDLNAQLDDCYDRFGIIGCFVVLCAVAPFLIPIVILGVSFDVRNLHTQYYFECLDYALLWAS